MAKSLVTIGLDQQEEEAKAYSENKSHRAIDISLPLLDCQKN